MIKQFLLFAGLLFSIQLIAQTGIGTASPNASAKLDVFSTNKGFLPPRVALTSTSVFSPITGLSDASALLTAAGLLVYNTATVSNVTPGFYYWNGTAWIRLIVPTDNASNVTGTVAVANGGTGLSALGTGVVTFLGTPTSANLESAVTGETGSGALVFGTSPSFTTPSLGAASATSINRVAISTPATTATLSLADGSTLSTSGAYSTTLVSTNTTNITLPTSGTLATLTGAETFTNKTLTSPTLTTPILGVASATSLALTGTTSSTSTSTGALIVSGGAGIAGQIFAGSIQNTPIGNSTASSGSFTTIVASGNITATGNLTGGNSSTSNISGFTANVVSISANYNITTSDNGKVIQSTGASAISIAIPTGLPTGFNCTIVQMGAGQITFTGNYLNRGTFTKSASQYSVVSILHLGSNVILVTGEMSN